MPRSTPHNFYCQCPRPRREPQPPPASSGDPWTLAGRSGSVSYGVTAPSPWVLMHTLLCVCPPKWSLCFPQSCQNPAIKSHSPSKSDSPGIPAPIAGPPVWKPDVGLRTFTPMGGLLWYNCSLVCESPTQWLWDLILLWLCPSYHLTVASPSASDLGCLFWWVQCLPVDDYSAVSCESGALSRGSERTSFYSAILNQSSETFFF